MHHALVVAGLVWTGLFGLALLVVIEAEVVPALLRRRQATLLRRTQVDPAFPAELANEKPVALA
jgi:hypothetical protein